MDQNARANPPARSGTNPRACRTRDSECAQQSYTQNRAARAVSLPAHLPRRSTHHRAAAKYTKMHRTAPTMFHRWSAPPRYRAIQPAAPPARAPETSRPATAQTGTPRRSGHVSQRTSPRGGTVRNVHHKKDIPDSPRSAPPEKHSMMVLRPRARHLHSPKQSQSAVAETQQASRLPHFPKLSKLAWFAYPCRSHSRA